MNTLTLYIESPTLQYADFTYAWYIFHSLNLMISGCVMCNMKCLWRRAWKS